MLTAAWALAKKDLLSYFRDRTALLLGFLVPIVLVTVFGVIMTYAFGGSGGMPKISLWVIDQDHSDASQKLLDQLRNSTMISVHPNAKESAIDETKLNRMIADGDAHHGLVIPSGYGQNPQPSESVSLRMIRDPGRAMEDRIIQIALMQSTLFTNDSTQWRRSLKKMFHEDGMNESQWESFDKAILSANDVVAKFIEESNANQAIPNPTPGEATEPLASTPPASTTPDTTQSATTTPDTTTSFDPLANLERLLPVEYENVEPPDRSKRISYQQAQSVSGMSVMMLLFGLSGAGAILLAEKEAGTLRRLLALPIAPESILLGKYFYVILIGLAQMSILLVYGERVFGIGLYRDPVTLIALVISWVATASAFAMAIATFSTSAKQGDGLATVIILAMAALGGCWFPVQMLSLPTPLAILSKSTMTYWAMEGFQGMLWNNLSLWDAKILKAIGIQWLWTLILSSLSVAMYRRNYLH